LPFRGDYWVLKPVLDYEKAREPTMPTRACFYHYLPVDDAAMQWGFYVTGGGRCAIRPGDQYPPKGHPRLYDFAWNRGRVLPEFQIIFVSHGAGCFESRECGEVPLTSPAVIFLVPGAWHRYQPTRLDGWTEHWLSFNGELAHRWAESPPLALRCQTRPVRHAERLAARLNDLLERIDAYPTQNSVLLSLHAMAVLAEALEQTVVPATAPVKVAALRHPGDDDALVVHARELIWTQSHRELSVAQIARDLAVTRRTLERRFHAATGSTLLQDVTACRLGRAKRLLAETELLVKNVAYLAGFPSQEQMRVTFLKYEGLSPSDYRGKAYRQRKPPRG
jgi:AraC-like DNA-binding protein